MSASAKCNDCATGTSFIIVVFSTTSFCEKRSQWKDWVFLCLGHFSKVMVGFFRFYLYPHYPVSSFFTGHYSASSNATECSACPKGSFQGSEGQTSCQLCPIGSISRYGLPLDCKRLVPISPLRLLHSFHDWLVVLVC
jgi:hypothetical protein